MCRFVQVCAGLGAGLCGVVCKKKKKKKKKRRKPPTGRSKPRPAQPTNQTASQHLIVQWIIPFPNFPQTLRSAVMSVKDQEYIEACRACGTSDARIILRHILPNAMGPVLVQVTQTVARSVITVASLSFVGLGVSEPTPEWGGMLSFAKTQMRYYPYLSLFPGFAVVMSVMSLTLAGDGLRDAMDPRLRNG